LLVLLLLVLLVLLLLLKLLLVLLLVLVLVLLKLLLPVLLLQVMGHELCQLSQQLWNVRGCRRSLIRRWVVTAILSRAPEYNIAMARYCRGKDAACARCSRYGWLGSVVAAQHNAHALAQACYHAPGKISQGGSAWASALVR
jgi:hypothetical protein